jgi:hypothetical protein
MKLKWIPEVDDLIDACNVKRHVRLDVLPMPSDPTRVAGLVRMDDERAGLPGSHRSGQPMDIEVARSLAHKVAQERGADVIWIDDPSGLYPRHERTVGRMRTFPVHVMPGGKMTGDLRIDAISPEVAALVACGGPLVPERGSMSNLACEVFDGTKRTLFYRPPDGSIIA